MRRAVRLLQRAREAVSEDLVLVHPRGLSVLERNEDDVVAALRPWRAIPRAVERDERAALIVLRELRPRVERDAEWRPVRGEERDRLRLVRALADRLAAVAAI